MLGNLGATEVVVLGVVFLVFFGGKKIPELARGMGSAIKEFREAAKE